MPYTKNANHPLGRDGVIPEEIAALRPMLDTRPHMIPNYDDDKVADKHESMRGHATHDRARWFNEALRAGHVYRNKGDD